MVTAILAVLALLAGVFAILGAKVLGLSAIEFVALGVMGLAIALLVPSVPWRRS